MRRHSSTETSTSFSAPLPGWFRKATETQRHPAIRKSGIIGDLRNLNTPVLVGDGFVLRVLEVTDAEAWKDGEDVEQIRWFEAPGPAPLSNVVSAIKAWRSDWANEGPRRHWGIWTGEVLCGGVELRRRQDERANVSYLVFRHARGVGLASRALRLVTEWAFAHLDVDAVVAIVDELNQASCRVAEKVGFELTGDAEPWEHSETGHMLRFVLFATEHPDAGSPHTNTP